MGIVFLTICKDTSSIGAIYLNGGIPGAVPPAAGHNEEQANLMSTDNRFMTVAIILGVLGMGIGVGLVIASFLVGLGSGQSASLSSSGTTTIVAFLVLTLVLSVVTRRQKQVGGQG